MTEYLIIRVALLSKITKSPLFFFFLIHEGKFQEAEFPCFMAFCLRVQEKCSYFMTFHLDASLRVGKKLREKKMLHSYCLRTETTVFTLSTDAAKCNSNPVIYELPMCRSDCRKSCLGTQLSLGSSLVGGTSCSQGKQPRIYLQLGNQITHVCHKETKCCHKDPVSCSQDPTWHKIST